MLRDDVERISAEYLRSSCKCGFNQCPKCNPLPDITGQVSAACRCGDPRCPECHPQKQPPAAIDHMVTVAIQSPYGGDVEANLKFLDECSMLAARDYYDAHRIDYEARC